MIDVVVIMIITGVVKRSMPGALKMVCGAIVEEVTFALPPILVLTITASLAYKLKYSLTAVILGAVRRYMEKNRPVLLSGLSHALVHGLHSPRVSSRAPALASGARPRPAPTDCTHGARPRT